MTTMTAMFRRMESINLFCKNIISEGKLMKQKKKKKKKKMK